MFEWKPFLQHNEKEKEKKVNKRVNSATVGCFARGLMAREWGRILGRRRIDPLLSDMEREAFFWKEKMELDGGR